MYDDGLDGGGFEYLDYDYNDIMQPAGGSGVGPRGGYYSNQLPPLPQQPQLQHLYGGMAGTAVAPSSLLPFQQQQYATPGQQPKSQQQPQPAQQTLQHLYGTTAQLAKQYAEMLARQPEPQLQQQAGLPQPYAGSAAAQQAQARQAAAYSGVQAYGAPAMAAAASGLTPGYGAQAGAYAAQQAQPPLPLQPPLPAEEQPPLPADAPPPLPMDEAPPLPPSAAPPLPSGSPPPLPPGS